MPPLRLTTVVAGLAQLRGRAGGARAASADGNVAAFRVELAAARAQPPERDVLRAGDVPGLPLAALADVERDHLPRLQRLRGLVGGDRPRMPASASTARCFETFCCEAPRAE